jgi:hypothetical protein
MCFVGIPALFLRQRGAKTPCYTAKRPATPPRPHSVLSLSLQRGGAVRKPALRRGVFARFILAAGGSISLKIRSI